VTRKFAIGKENVMMLEQHVNVLIIFTFGPLTNAKFIMMGESFNPDGIVIQIPLTIIVVGLENAIQMVLHVIALNNLIV
jgi:hypothetical protein